jgi:hypothetical protein
VDYRCPREHRLPDVAYSGDSSPGALMAARFDELSKIVLSDAHEVGVSGRGLLV